MTQEDKSTVIALLAEAVKNGCREAIACNDLEIDVKTWQRWRKDTEDKRRGPLSAPANKLSPEEVAEVIRVTTSKEYMDLPPCQIVPLLADKGVYIATTSRLSIRS